MNRIDERFKALREAGQKAFIPYITCGDPTLKDTAALMTLLEKNGADIIEVGIPHSDPVADGTTIQTSTRRALKNGTTPKKVLNVLEKVRKRSEIPIVLLTYYNIVIQYGIERFVAEFSTTADGMIVADLPPEEASEVVHFSKRNEFANIFLASPITPRKRVRQILDATSGFLYVVSLLGVTGERETVSPKIRDFMRAMKSSTSMPLCVGFGISRPEHVREIVDLGADGVIVGSGIVRRAQSVERVARYVRKMAIPTKNIP
jgi:tryptophan synthase alpha chain